MRGEDKGRFHKLATGVMMNYDKTMTPELLAAWWGQLEGCSFADVERSMIQHMRAEKFAPRLSDILGRIPSAGNCAYPGAEEAWGMCPKYEAETAWVFPEMLVAYVACHWQREQGDMIGARMAFIEAYRAAIANARGYPAWRISDGNSTTQEQREAARMAMMDQHPERTTPGQIERQRRTLALMTGSRQIGGALLSLASDAGTSVKDVTVQEVKERLEALKKAVA